MEETASRSRESAVSDEEVARIAEHVEAAVPEMSEVSSRSVVEGVRVAIDDYLGLRHGDPPDELDDEIGPGLDHGDPPE